MHKFARILTAAFAFAMCAPSLAAGTPKWVKGVSVNGDGNIVITVNPKGLMIIFK